MLQLLYHSLMTKLSTPPFLKKFSKHLKKFTYLFTALSSSACTSHKFTTLRNCLNIWHMWPSTECSW